MRLAIADPPYLGRANRWYGSGGRGAGKGAYRPDEHPEAAEWDNPGKHLDLCMRLQDEYDSWAIAMHATSLATYLQVAPRDARVMSWVRTNAMPDGALLKSDWEPVLVYVHPDRRPRSFEHGHPSSDVLVFGQNRSGFLGSKPAQWTRWVLAALQYQPRVDSLTDLFPGSGAVARAADGMLH